MIDERLEAQASLYALGALTPEEITEFEQTLRDNPQLQQLVRELRGTAHAMVAAFPRVIPPAHIKGRVLAAVADRNAAADTARPPAWMAWMPWAMAACFAILCGALISVGHKLRQQAQVLNEQMLQHDAATAELERQLAHAQAIADSRTSNYEQRIVQTEQRAAQRIQDLQRQSGIVTNQLLREQAALRSEIQVVRDRAEQLAREKQVLEEAIGGSALASNQRLATARIAVLRPTADGSPRALGASVWLTTDRRGLLVLESMPPPHASQDYQLWLLDANAPAPVSAGVFRPDANGAVRLEYNAANAAAVDRFAVTLEPKGGVARPTGKMVLASN